MVTASALPVAELIAKIKENYLVSGTRHSTDMVVVLFLWDRGWQGCQSPSSLTSVILQGRKWKPKELSWFSCCVCDFGHVTSLFWAPGFCLHL